MTSIAIIGTSHTGALRLAWKDMRAHYAGITVEFFAAPSQIYRKFRFRDRLFGYFGSDRKSCEITRRINGQMEIDLSGADTAVLVGTNVGFPKMGHVIAKCDVDGLAVSGKRTLLSDAVFRSACTGIVRRALEDLRAPAWNGVNVVALPKPIFAASSTKRNRPAEVIWNRAAERGDALKKAMAIHSGIARTELADRAITYIDQPAETLDANCFTHNRFSRGALRLIDSQEYAPETRGHMNADFGTIVMTDLLARLVPGVGTPHKNT